MNKYVMVYLDSWPYIHKHDILFQNIRITFHVINFVTAVRREIDDI